MRTLICSVCNQSLQAEPIALFNPDIIQLPLTAQAFLPLSASHEPPFPFPETPWHAMRCPFCGATPFCFDFDAFSPSGDVFEELENISQLSIMTAETGAFMIYRYPQPNTRLCPSRHRLLPRKQAAINRPPRNRNSKQRNKAKR